MEAANASIKEVHRVGMNLQLAFNTVLRDPSEELSNTATSSTTDLTIDEESSSEQGELIRKNKYQRTRKSAELARRKIIQDKKGRFTYVKTSSLSEFTRENSCDKNICKFDAKCSLGISLNCGDCTNTNHYHISRLEHVCQQCYEEFKMGKPLFGRYMDWKQHWIEESRCVPFLRMFIFEEFLPYWLSCSDCGKFRQISRSKDSTLSPTILSMFKCAHAFPPGLDDPCSLPEEKEVSEVRSAPSLYIKSLGAPPLLQHSPAIYFLEDHYFYDEVGISPVNAQMRHEAKKDFMFPFNIPNEASKAFSLRPDILEHDEICAFPEFAKDQILYLAIRNLVVALWNLNPYEYLDYEKCLSYLICPGLARVWYSIELKRVLDYLILKNVINYGVLPIPKDTLLGRKNAQKLEVVVVGGGISGIGAARQLRYLGANVVLLEAKSKLGGRMQDDWSLGVAVGCGAQLVTGIINNPIILMCEQIELPYRLLSDDCPLIDAKSGRLVTPVSDRVVDEHFNCLLDIIGHWKNEENVKDVDLLSQIHDLHEKLLKHIDFKWAKEFDRLLQWQIGNVEFSCGALLSEVSAKHWDQNEDVGQFAGAHALLSHGSGELIKRLAEGIDVRCGHHVVDIDYTNAKKIVVKCGNGKRYTCDKVLLCLPLTQYQKRQIKFQPELPLEKLMASHALGCGLIEKVAVRFPHRFWSSLLKSDGTIDYFGHVPKTDKGRGLFNMFYDFSTRGTARKQQQYVLMSYICGESVQLVNEKTDLEVVEEFLNILQELFPKENIPAPTGYVVTHWGKDPHIGMSYSFMRLGASGNDYDEMSRSVDNRLYFAGECTSRFFPQTMTGAYVSALRESSKIVEDWLKFN